uniref:Myosin IXB n=1 Tax=Bos mutus grunniens TaxID=30521 RepID=A0A8B9YTC0_BOSMU
MSVNEAGSAGRRGQAAYHLHIYPQLATSESQAPPLASCRVPATKDSTTSDVIQDAVARLQLDGSKRYVLVEVKETGGEEWVLDASDSPVHRVLLWPRRAHDEHPREDGYYFLLQERDPDGTIKYLHMQLASQATATRRLVERGLLPRPQADFDDLCNLPELTEENLLKNLRHRFLQQKIYTYAGSILVAVNPFKFLPIYNPKYVKMYENQQLGKLEPHVFALADVAYYAMLRKHINQCIVISGESGSGKTQSTNFLIHCLTALSQKGYASGVERTILGAGPVLEAFGNAKTAHNNNSSRFGKFIQVNYLESGIVRGGLTSSYRSASKNNFFLLILTYRNYHVFYYLLLGVSEEERREFQLKQPEDYFYLNQHNLKIEDGEDLKHDFERLKQAMEMVGFLPATKKQIFSILSAILYLGNITYRKRATGRDEGLEVGPPEALDTLSQLLKVKREILVEVLTKRKTVTSNDKLILPYSLSEAITARDSMAKSLYSALFDWIVLRINHALLNKKDMEESVSCLSIGVLDIFGFEDFERNSFEQFCINYANEQLQYYFNQHIFKLEQEEYQSEGISWHNIDYTDNVGCIHLISKKPTGLFYLLDEESNFPHATSQTLLAKFKQQHEDNRYFLGTPVMEPAFIIQHFAGKVKYQIKDFREKNMDYMRPDIVALLRGSDSSYVRELIGMDPVAVFRWAVLRAAIQAMAVLREAGRLRAERAEKAAGRSSGAQGHLGELQRGASTPSEKLYRDLHDQIIRSIKGLPWQGDDPRKLLQSLNRLQKPRTFILKSKGIKQKQIIPKNLLDSKSLKLIISMTLHDRTTKSLLHLHKKKKPPSISAQFQTSLNKLLETLGKAEPFFIRCIRSNAEKKELCFDDELVLQQLRYTGMLETVRIRRSGYSAKYSFQDFTEQFQVLLPKNAQPCREVISALLEKMDIDKRSYQIGKTKVFLKETERQALQETLHQEVVRKILMLQSWFRMVLERRHFLQMRQAAITIQACWRSYCVRRALERTQAAVFLQAAWRGYRQRAAYQRQRQSIIRLQSLCRGHLQRKSFSQMVEEKQKAEEKEREAEQAAKKETVEAGLAQAAGPEPEQGLEPSTEGEPLDLEPEVWLSDGALPAESCQPEKEVPSVEKVPPTQKHAAEGREKVPRSREKRESRRQRGLEHVKLQNKHIQSCKDEHTLRELSGKAVPGSEESLPEDRKEVREDESPSDARTEMEMAAPKKQPQVPPQAAPSSLDSGAAQAGSPRPSHEERPTSLALDSRVTVLGPSATPETPKDKSKPGIGPRAQERPDSPGGSTQIQRYRDPDTERLANAVELWRGKKLMTTGSNTMLSQSLDLSERHRAVGPTSISAALAPPEAACLCSPSPTPLQPSAETDGEPSTKKLAIQKKKSADAASGTDASLSPGSAESKSTFKRLFLHKNKDKKFSPEGGEETESAIPGQAILEAATTKKNLEVPSSHQHRHATGEKHPKEPGGKGKKNRNLKIGKITVSEKWRESVFRKITNANELKYLDEFLLNKVNDSCSQKTPIESLFIKPPKFRSNLKTMYSVPNGKIHVGYKDLMENYQIVVSNLAAERGEKDTNLVLNLFQSLLDEFTQSKAQKKKRKQERAVLQHNGHVFVSYQVSIPQSCEQCLSYIWLMDKALLCSVCKTTCHKKCMHKIQACSIVCGKKTDPGAESGHFGVCVDSLTSDKVSVPIVLEKLLEHVEMHGLYTEGLYRKSGAANRTRELRQALQTDPTAVKLENFPIHAITGVLKQWLRELPEPLMTFAQYGDFLHAVELPEKQEQLAAIYAVLEHLPEANHNSLERLIFHLVKVALLEDVNRMSPSALAIIFAPCLLRCPDNSDPLISMKDVLKITTCVEMLIKEQMRKYKVKMEEISQLEAAESMACRRLSLLRQNAPWPLKLGFSSPYEGVLMKNPKARGSSSSGPEELGVLQEEEAAGGDEDREKEILIERIQSIKEEKQDITYRLPELDPRGSDEENLDSETSASTESLLEERAGRGASEGPPAPALPCPGAPTPSPLPEAAAPPRRRPSSFMTVRLPPGLPSYLPGRAPGTQEAATMVRRREPPARRPDQVHSVYITPGTHLPIQGPQEPLDKDDRPPGAKRRYSDPPTYCLPSSSGQANG